MDDVRLSEMHDAVVECMKVEAQRVTLEFSHLPTFQLVGSDKYRVWSYRGRLVLANPTKVTVELSGGAMRISDGTIVATSSGRSDELTPLLDSTSPIDVMQITFDEGGRLIATGGTAIVELAEGLELDETWEGSLQSS